MHVYAEKERHAPQEASIYSLETDCQNKETRFFHSSVCLHLPKITIKAKPTPPFPHKQNPHRHSPLSDYSMTAALRTVPIHRSLFQNFNNVYGAISKGLLPKI